MFQIKKKSHLISGSDMNLIGKVLFKTGENEHITFEEKEIIEKILNFKTYLDFVSDLFGRSKLVLVKRDEQRQKIIEGIEVNIKDYNEVFDKMKNDKFGFTEQDLEKINKHFNLI